MVVGFVGGPVGQCSSSVAVRIAAAASVGVAVAGVAEELEVLDVGGTAVVQPFLEVVGVTAVDASSAFGAAAGGDDQ